MKVINVTEFKAHLSRYLRQASRGARITVQDRSEPIAELGPVPAARSISWHDRLADAGRLRRGTQEWKTLRVSSLGRPIDIQALLRAVREDSNEVRRRERGTPAPVR